jgi:hypothetical protein
MGIFNGGVSGAFSKIIPAGPAQSLVNNISKGVSSGSAFGPLGQSYAAIKGAESIYNNGFSYGGDGGSAKQWCDSARGETARRNRSAKGDQLAEQMATDQENFYAQRPQFISPVDENGMLKQGFQYNPETIGYGDRYGQGVNSLNTLQKISTMEGPTQYGQAQLNYQQNMQAGLRDDLNRDLDYQTANAYEQMAQTAGMDSGAASRLYGRSTQQALQEQQRLARQGAEQQLGIVAGDEGRKFQTLSNLPGQEMQYAQYQSNVDRGNADAQNAASRYNIQNQMGAGQNLYNTQYQQWRDLGAMKGDLAQAQGQVQNAYNAPSTWQQIESFIPFQSR